MRALIQRVTECSVSVENEPIAGIGPGLLVLLGVARQDEKSDADYLAEKITHLRIFEDDQKKMNHSLTQTGGEMLVVSQFTLLADCRKGRRPSFINAAEPEKADTLYQYFTESVRKKGIPVKTGRFQAMMAVALINDGPVTILLESRP